MSRLPTSVAVLIGLGAIALAYVPRFAEETLLAFAAITGLLVALARPLPQGLGVLLAAAIGLSLALDSPPEALSLMQANLTLLGTALGAVLLLLALLQATSRLRQHWQRIGARIVGSWIAASAILVLALRLRALGARGPALLGQKLLAVDRDLLDRVGEHLGRLRAGDRGDAAEDEGRHAVDAGVLGGIGHALDLFHVGVAGQQLAGLVRIHADVGCGSDQHLAVG